MSASRKTGQKRFEPGNYECIEENAKPLAAADRASKKVRLPNLGTWRFFCASATIKMREKHFKLRHLGIYEINREFGTMKFAENMVPILRFYPYMPKS